MPKIIYDVAVVGSGYWGTSIALKAAEAGKSVIVIANDDPKGGSINASGILDPKVYFRSGFEKRWPADWAKSELDDSIAWLLDHGAYRVMERFWNEFRKTPARDNREMIYVPSVTSFTDQIYQDRYGIVITKGTVYGLSGGLNGSQELRYTTKAMTMEGHAYARNVVFATGYRTDELLDTLSLSKMGVGRLWGRGFNAKGTPKTDLPVSVMIRPYCKHTVRQWADGTIKVGDTAEEKPSDKKYAALKAVGEAAIDNMKIVFESDGYRPVTDRYLVHKYHERPIIVATGGHRLGLGTAPIAANKVLQCLS